MHDDLSGREERFPALARRGVEGKLNHLSQSLKGGPRGHGAPALDPYELRHAGPNQIGELLLGQVQPGSVQDDLRAIGRYLLRELVVRFRQ